VERLAVLLGRCDLGQVLAQSMPEERKPKLLVVELWGMGDLVIASPFLQGASERFDVTLVAKPYALDLQVRFWPQVEVIPFVAPWTAFEHKYRLLRWPWLDLIRLERRLREQRFDFGLSARWDPRDHFLLTVAGARERIGFPRMRSQLLLTKPLPRPDPSAHRHESWRAMGKALGFELPPRQRLGYGSPRSGGTVLVHTGAGQPVRVWPLERYQRLVKALREHGHEVQVACDFDQRNWWLEAGESSISAPNSMKELFALLDRTSAFIGNDSGPGHLASFCGIPTFTLFGPQLPEWFAPLHPSAEWLPGKACPYKPCSDYCRFDIPICMTNWSYEEVWPIINRFLGRVLIGATQPVLS